MEDANDMVFLPGLVSQESVLFSELGVRISLNSNLLSRELGFRYKFSESES